MPSTDEMRQAGANHDPDASLAELTRRLSEQSTRLAHQELDLARAELTDKGREIGAGAGALSAAGALALVGLGALAAAAVIILATTALATWLAAAIVAAACLGLAGILALAGKRRVQSAGSPVPQAALASSQRDLDEVKRKAKEARS